MSIKKWIPSKSACSKYMDCPAAFNYYYNEKIEPVKLGSALMFGSGLDAAFDSILMQDGSPIELYDKKVNEFELGKINPSKYDYDSDLLDEKTRASLLIDLKEFGYKGDDVNGLYDTLLNKESLSSNQEKALDLISRYSLREKATIIIKAYEREVNPHIAKVYNIQKKSGSGRLDATVEWKGVGKVILDNKTSAKRYLDNSLEYSVQLALYAAEENVREVAYVVCVKNILKNKIKKCAKCEFNGTGKRHKTCDNLIDGKRCDGDWVETIAPDADIQIIFGEITDRAIEVAREVQESVIKANEAKIYPCNFEKCNNQYGKPCDYRDLKWKGSMDGLQIRKEKK